MDPKLELTSTNLKARETMFDMENYNDYVEMEKKNIISQKIKASKKCYNCTFYGCNKKYSAPYNLKVGIIINLDSLSFSHRRKTIQMQLS